MKLNSKRNCSLSLSLLTNERRQLTDSIKLLKRTLAGPIALKIEIRFRAKIGQLNCFSPRVDLAYPKDRKRFLRYFSNQILKYDHEKL